MKYKKIYIEITNVCNLNCSFCAKHHRKQEFMSRQNFVRILEKIKAYTDYLYFHVMGEPLLHPKINEFIRIAISKGFKVNITSNGYLINQLEDYLGIRQINLSLHSFHAENGKNLEDYLETIFLKVKKLAEEGTYVNYRLWVMNETAEIILKKLQEQYQTVISKEDKTKTLSKNIFYSKENQFVWPVKRLEKGKCYSMGSCRALKDHIAILVDGTAVPCCLDNDATIPLGNIFINDLADIIKNSIYSTMLLGFNNNQKINKFCQNCNFYDSKF